jgi:hypothetical protein
MYEWPLFNLTLSRAKKTFSGASFFVLAISKLVREWDPGAKREHETRRDCFGRGGLSALALKRVCVRGRAIPRGFAVRWPPERPRARTSVL